MSKEIKNLIISINIMDSNRLIEKIVKNSFTSFQGDDLYIDVNLSEYIVVKDRQNDEIIYYIELVYKNNVALINYISEYSIEKYNLLNSLRNIKEIDNIKIIVDNFSNSILANNYEKLYVLENLMRLSILNELINEYKDNFKNHIKFIEHHEEKRNHLPNNFNNILQRTDFNGFLKYIESNNLGGNESNRYKEVIEDKDKLKELRDKDIFNDIKNVIRGNDGFDHVKETILHFRNFIAHNKIIEDYLFEENCTSTICKINEEILNKYMNRSIFDKLNLEEDSLINGTLMLIEKDMCGSDEEKIYFMKILLELNIIPNITIDNDVLLSMEGDYKFEFYKLENCTSIYVLFIHKVIHENSKNIDMEKLVKFIANESSEIYYIFDFSSNFFNKYLYKEFNFFENNLRAYLSILNINKDKSFVEGESITENTNPAKKILQKNEERLFFKESNLKVSNLINNQFFEEDTGKLRTYLTNSLDTNNNTNSTIKGLIDKYISNGNGGALKKKLFTVMEWDTNLQIINTEWETIEMYRNIVAHNNILFSNEYKNINSIMVDVNKAIISSFIGLLNQFYDIVINIDIAKEKLNLKFKSNNEAKVEVEYEDIKAISENCEYQTVIIFINRILGINLNKNILFFNNDILNLIIGCKEVDSSFTKENFVNTIQEAFTNILITEGQNNTHYLECEINEIMNLIELKWNA